jgi:hypothetical protein
VTNLATFALAAGLTLSPLLAAAQPAGNHLFHSQLEASDIVGQACFGCVVALSADGTTALVGGPFDSGGTGAAWVYTYDVVDATWYGGQKLVGSGADTSSNQGHAVALSADGSTALVGGPGDANGIGAVWVFARGVDGAYEQQGPKLVAVDTPGCQGRSVAIAADGNTALIGVPCFGDINGGKPGAAVVWTRSAGVWTRDGPRLIGSGAVGDAGTQGHAVALSADGQTALIGAPMDDPKQFSPNRGVGAAWIWTHLAGGWTQQGSKLVGGGAVGPAFQGASVALSGDGDVALVGGPHDTDYAGAVWVWYRFLNAWQPGPKLVTPDATATATLGSRVALSVDGYTAIVSAPSDETTGATFVWTYNFTGWTQRPKIAASSPSVAISGDGVTAIVGPRTYVATDDMIQNGTFSADAAGWRRFATPDATYMVSQVTAGVYEYYRVAPPAGTSNQAVVYQNTGVPLGLGAPLIARFDLGNSSSARKRVSVLLLDSGFQDLSVCTFWLPPNAPLRTYQMKTHTTTFWGNASIYFYAATAGSAGGYYRLDNVSLKYSPGNASSFRTECVDPTAPVASGGTDGPDMLTNGGFDTGALAPWGTFGTITSRIAAGVFEFIRPSNAAPAGVVLQATGESLAANMTVTATFQLGNSSSVRKRVTVILHDNDFTDLSACTLWLAANQPLSPYVMKAFSTKSWANATVSVYPATVGSESWIRLDDVTLRRTPSATLAGTECIEPSARGPIIRSSSVVPAPRSAAEAGRDRNGDVPALGTPRRQIESMTSTPGGFWQLLVAGPDSTTWEWSDPIDLREVSDASMSIAIHAPGDERAPVIMVQCVDTGSWLPLAVNQLSPPDSRFGVDLSLVIGEVVRLRLVRDREADKDLGRFRSPAPLQLTIDPSP